MVYVMMVDGMLIGIPDFDVEILRKKIMNVVNPDPRIDRSDIAFLGTQNFVSFSHIQRICCKDKNTFFRYQYT